MGSFGRIQQLLFRVFLVLPIAQVARAESPDILEGLADEDSSTSSADSWARSDEANRLFFEGREHHRQGRIEPAYAAYHRAWILKQSFDIAGNLAQVEVLLGLVPDAAEHFRFALSNLPLEWTPELESVAARLRKQFEAARAQVGALEIDAPAGTEVVVNQRPVGRAPLGLPVFVEPGARTVLFENADGGRAERTIEVEAGQSLRVTAPVLIPRKPRWISRASPGTETAPASAERHTEPALESRWSATRTTALVSSLAFAGLAGSAGVALVLAEKNAAEDSRVLRKALSGADCRNPGAQTKCLELHQAIDRADTYRNWSNVALVGVSAGLLSAFCVTVLWEPFSSGPVIAVVPRLDPGMAGLNVQGTF